MSARLYDTVIKMYKQWSNFRKFIADIHSSNPCPQNSENFREDYVMPELKEWSLETFGPLNSYGDRCFKFSYIRIPAIPAVTIARAGSWPATFSPISKILVQHYREKSRARSWYSPVVIRRNCNKASGGGRTGDLYVSDILSPATKIIRSFLKNGWIAITNHRSSFINWCQLFEKEACYFKMRRTSR